MKIKPRKPKPITFSPNKILLNINHFVFWAYYRRVPEFFHQWTILDSIQNFASNYETRTSEFNSSEKLIGELIKLADKDKQEISNLKLQMLGMNPDVIDHLNKMLGLKITTNRDN